VTEHFLLHAVRLETVIVNVTNRWEATVLFAVVTSEVPLEVGFVSKGIGGECRKTVKHDRVYDFSDLLLELFLH